MNFLLLHGLYLMSFMLLAFYPITAQVLDEHELNQLSNELGLPESETLVTEQTQIAEINSKLNLNTIDIAALKQLLFLQPPLIDELASFLKDHKPLKSIYELQSPGIFSKEQLKLMMNLFYVDNDQAFKSNRPQNEISKENLFVLRWDRKLKKGIEYLTHDSIPASYAGSPDRMVFRMKCRINHLIKFNLLMEKDAGERWLGTNQLSIPDYISAHVQMNCSNALFRKLILGDFGIKIGQGLILDNASFISNTTSPSSIALKPQSYLKPNNSMSENEFLRGLVVESRLKNAYHLLSYISFRWLDASITSELDSTGSVVSKFTSLVESGKHRTANEIKSKNILSQLLGGITVGRSLTFGQIGLNLVYLKYGLQRKASNDIAKYGIPLDKETGFGSLDYTLHFGRITAFGESALDHYGHLATSHSALIALGKKASLLLTGHYFSPEFYAEKSKSNSSTGLSWNDYKLSCGFDMSLNKYWQCNIAAAVAQQPKAAFLYINPKNSFFKVELQWIKRKHSRFRFQFLMSAKGAEAIQYYNETPLTDQIKGYTKSQLYYEKQLNKLLVWRIRLQWTSNGIWAKKTSGWFFSQDINGKLEVLKLNFWLRLSYYDTNKLKINFYAFENDLRYQYAVSSFSGTGLRYYLKLGFKIKSSLSLELKISNTISYNPINSGYSAIQEVEDDWEFKSQITYQF